MKQCIFVVDDTLTDIFGYLLLLQTILAPKVKSPEDVSIYYMHICWNSSEDEQKQYESLFQSALREAQGALQKHGSPYLRHIEYVPIDLDEKIYCSDEKNINKIIDEIINKQKNCLREKGISETFIYNFPYISDNDTKEAAYVLLLDIILCGPQRIDQERIQNNRPVLSSSLYKQFPNAHCIAYTNYQGYYGDQWMSLADADGSKPPFTREHITRARAIFVRFKESLLSSLCL